MPQEKSAVTARNLIVRLIILRHIYVFECFLLINNSIVNIEIYLNTGSTPPCSFD